MIDKCQHPKNKQRYNYLSLSTATELKHSSISSTLYLIQNIISWPVLTWFRKLEVDCKKKHNIQMNTHFTMNLNK